MAWFSWTFLPLIIYSQLQWVPGPGPASHSLVPVEPTCPAPDRGKKDSCTAVSPCAQGAWSQPGWHLFTAAGTPQVKGASSSFLTAWWCCLTPLKEKFCNLSTLVALSWIGKLMCLKVSLMKNSIHQFCKHKKLARTRLLNACCVLAVLFSHSQPKLTGQ